jgi:hypothetical protein
MRENIKLTEELNKMLFLAGINNSLMENKKPSKESTSEVNNEEDEEKTNEKKEKELDSDLEQTSIDIQKANSDYLKTLEKDYLSFPMKVSMLIGNGEIYQKLLYNIYQILYLRKAYEMKLFSPGSIDSIEVLQKKQQEIIKDITKQIAPEFSNSNLVNLEQALNLISKNIIKRANIFLTDKIKKVNINGELDKFLDLDSKRKYLEKIGAYKELQEIIPSIESLKKNLYPNTKNQKASISEKLNAKDNELKLTPQGFWQIQFLSRVAANKPKDELEEMLFGNNHYAGLALATLKDFYTSALFPMITTLTGRKFNLNPNDTEFKIIQDTAWDKIKDGLTVENKYDVARQNFGAWAISVARNSVIDEIKKITNIEFVNTRDIAFTISEMKYNTLSFKKPLETIIPKIRTEKTKSEAVVNIEDYCTLINQKDGTFTYEFFSPEELFNFFNTIKSIKGEIPYSFISELTSQSRQLLKNIGALKSVKKFADVWPEETGEEVYDVYAKKATGEARDNMFKELYDFYKSISKMSFSNDKLKETQEYRKIKEKEDDGTEYNIYSEEELQDAFERDMGKALYFYQAEFAKNLPVIKQKIPTEAIQNFIKKYINTMPETTASEKIDKEEALKEADKLNRKNKGDLLTYSLFFNNRDIGKGLVAELEPYVIYKYKEARELLKGVVPYLKNEFKKQQEEEKKKTQISADTKNMYPKPIYTFSDDDSVWQQVGYAIADFNLHKAKKEEKRKKMVYTSGRENALMEDTINFIAERFFNIKLYKPSAGQIFHLKEIEKIPFQVRTALIETQGQLNPEMINKFITLKSPGEDVINYFNSENTIKSSYIINKKSKLIESIKSSFDVEKKVKELLASRRPQELRRLSKIFSGISGVNIQLENKNYSIDEINNYLLKIKQNFIKKILI